jgi:cytochrome c-type biogenesis protein CcmH
MKIKIFLFIAYVLTVTHVQTNDSQTKLLKVYKNLRCLVCQGQSIADSNSDFAITIKLVIQDQFNEGRTEDEVYNFLTSKYGEWIVYKPTFSKGNLLLWFLPYFVFITGGLIIFFIIKKSKYNKDN